MKKIKVEVIMENIPDEAIAENIATEMKLMLEKEYADGVTVFTSVSEQPEKLRPLAKIDTEEAAKNKEEKEE